MIGGILFYSFWIAAQALEVTTAGQQLKAKKAAEALHSITAVFAGGNRLVADKPFSAESITETVQTLADGSRVVRHNETQYFRDRSGRSRREQTIESLGPRSPIAPVRIVFISDPVLNVDSVLDPLHQTVRKFGRLEMDQPRSIDDGGQQLGKRLIEGLECIGTRQTVNAGSIRIVTETWFARAIEAIVRSKTVDPRGSETSYELHHVAMGDQPRALFEVPAGYRIEFEGKPGVMMRRVRP